MKELSPTVLTGYFMNFILNIRTIFDFRHKKLSAYFELVSKACNKIPITLKDSLH